MNKNLYTKIFENDMHIMVRYLDLPGHVPPVRVSLPVEDDLFYRLEPLAEHICNNSLLILNRFFHSF